MSQDRKRRRIDHHDDGKPHFDRTLWFDMDQLDTGLYNLAVEIAPPGQMVQGAGISLSPDEVAEVMASMASWLAEMAKART